MAALTQYEIERQNLETFVLFAAQSGKPDLITSAKEAVEEFRKKWPEGDDSLRTFALLLDALLP